MFCVRFHTHARLYSLIISNFYDEQLHDDHLLLLAAPAASPHCDNDKATTRARLAAMKGAKCLTLKPNFSITFIPQTTRNKIYSSLLKTLTTWRSFWSKVQCRQTAARNALLHLMQTPFTALSCCRWCRIVLLLLLCYCYFIISIRVDFIVITDVTHILIIFSLSFQFMLPTLLFNDMVADFVDAIACCSCHVFSPPYFCCCYDGANDDAFPRYELFDPDTARPIACVAAACIWI